MATITQEQLKGILDRRPEGATPQSIMRSLIERGHKIEGFDDRGGIAKTKRLPETPKLPKTWQEMKGGEKAVSVLKELPSAAIDVLASSEKAFGQSIADAIVAPYVAKGQKEYAERQHKIVTRLIDKFKATTDPELKERTRKELKRLGVSKAIRDQVGVKKLAEITPSVEKSAKQIYGEAAGVALDILVAGQYGEAVKGAKAFKLFKPAKLIAPVYKKAGEAFVKGAVKGAARGAPIGFAFGVSSALQQDKTWQEVAEQGIFSGITSAVLSGITGGLWERARFKAPEREAAIRAKALKSYQRGLETTKEKFKKKAEKIIPELIDKKYWGTKRTLLKKASQGVELSQGQYVELGELQGLAEIDGVTDMILGEMDALKIGGRVPSVSQSKFKALNELLADVVALKATNNEIAPEEIKILASQLEGEDLKRYVENLKTLDLPNQVEWEATRNEIIGSLTGENPANQANQEDIRKLAQQYGKTLYETRKSFKTITDNTKLSQVRKVDSAIRNLLNTKNPDYAQVNKIYHLNTELYDILDETITRKASHKIGGLFQRIASLAGAVTGFARGGVSGAVIGGGSLMALTSILDSTWFNTLNAVAQDMIADQLTILPERELPHIMSILASGKGQEISESVLKLFSMPD